MAETTETPSPTAPDASSPAAPPARGRRQVKVGRVVSNKMAKTVVVAVENTVTHRLYHRYMKRTSTFAAHDEENQCKVGDQVEIAESRPISKEKHWVVSNILRRGAGV